MHTHSTHRILRPLKWVEKKWAPNHSVYHKWSAMRGNFFVINWNKQNNKWHSFHNSVIKTNCDELIKNALHSSPSLFSCVQEYLSFTQSVKCTFAYIARAINRNYDKKIWTWLAEILPQNRSNILYDSTVTRSLKSKDYIWTVRDLMLSSLNWG